MATATQTVLFTDLADYTENVARSDREGLRRILEQHEGRVRPLVERYGGRIVKNIGDSFLCLFPAATDALRAAMGIQSLRKSAEGLSLRLAVTTGDIEMIDDDAFGECVNLAARILSKTPADEVWFGAGTRVCMNAAEIPWESVGWFRLKGVPAEQECFRVVPEDRVWLPHGVATAVEEGKLVRIAKDRPIPPIPPDPVILFEGFEPGSAQLADAMDRLPVLDPASLYLATYRISTRDRQQWTESASGLVIATPEAVDAAIAELTEPVAYTPERAAVDDSDTILLDHLVRPDLELVLCGLALPAVPLADVVAGYYYDLLPDGSWVTHSEHAILRIEVSPQQVVLHARCPDISVAGALIASGQSVALQDHVTIGTPAGALQFCPTKLGYAGVLLRDTGMKLGLKNGQTAELGRRPNPPGLAFPSREGQENIRWCSGPRASRARTEHFTLDRVLAGRQQAAVKPARGSIELIPLHDECATFVLREGRLGRVKRPVRVRIGDMVVAGTTVVALRAP